MQKSTLADAKIHAAEIQEIILEKNKIIAELEKAFEFKSKLIRRFDAYYEIDENGDANGYPYCSHCWEVEHKTIHLVSTNQMRARFCPACKNQYDARLCGAILSPSDAEETI